MDATTRDKLISGDISSQQSLVDVLKKKQNTKQITHIIPGGKVLFTKEHPVDKDDLEAIISTSLRRCNLFEDMTFSFLKDISDKLSQNVKLHSFPKAKSPFWEEKGRDELAKLLAQLIVDQKDKPTVLLVNKEGIWSQAKVSTAKDDKPGGDNWEPQVKFTRRSRDQYQVI